MLLYIKQSKTKTLWRNIVLGIKKASNANGKKVMGVCAGFARHFKMDVGLLRVITVLCSVVFFPIVPILYLIFALIMEEEV